MEKNKKIRLNMSAKEFSELIIEEKLFNIFTL